MYFYWLRVKDGMQKVLIRGSQCISTKPPPPPRNAQMVFAVHTRNEHRFSVQEVLQRRE